MIYKNDKCMVCEKQLTPSWRSDAMWVGFDHPICLEIASNWYADQHKRREAITRSLDECNLRNMGIEMRG
jgi:hypothetical protein